PGTGLNKRAQVVMYNVVMPPDMGDVRTFVSHLKTFVAQRGATFVAYDPVETTFTFEVADFEP
ncbi:hypothetical protein EON68_01755, partial [archaeon]